MYDVAETAFQAAVGTHKPRWGWLEEKITVQDLKDGNCGTNGGRSAYPGPFGSELDKAVEGKDGSEPVSRPELAIFNLEVEFTVELIYMVRVSLWQGDAMADKLPRLSLGGVRLRGRG